jgi:hypothetical protein
LLQEFRRKKGAKKNSCSKNLVAKMARKIVASKKSRQEFRRKKARRKIVAPRI